MRRNPHQKPTESFSLKKDILYTFKPVLNGCYRLQYEPVARIQRKEQDRIVALKPTPISPQERKIQQWLSYTNPTTTK